MMVWFGPAGTADSFAAMGYKKTVQLPEYLERMGVDAFEYQCGRGVRVNPDTAAALKAGQRLCGRFSRSLLPAHNRCGPDKIQPHI